jgi:hypothetical protein
MNNSKKESRRSTSKRAMDGIINAPNRPQLSGKPFGPQGLNGDTLRTNTRSIGNFNQSAGYHLANTSVSSSDTNQPQKGGPSLLHMTLPGEQPFSGKGKKEKKRGRKQGHDWHRIRKFTLRGGLVALVLCLLVGGFLFAKGYLKLHKVFKGGGSAVALKSNVNPSLLKGEGDGRVNILLLGRGRA